MRLFKRNSYKMKFHSNLMQFCAESRKLIEHSFTFECIFATFNQNFIFHSLISFASRNETIVENQTAFLRHKGTFLVFQCQFCITVEERLFPNSHFQKLKNIS